jgi:hypothetical protein
VIATGDELNLNIREDADPTRVRARNAVADASDEEEDYGHLSGFEVGQCVWYKNSEGEEMRGRVTRVEGDEIDLNIREEADIERVRERDPEDEASDDDGVEMPQLMFEFVDKARTSHDWITIAAAHTVACTVVRVQSTIIWTRSLRRRMMRTRRTTAVNTKKTAKYTPQTVRCFIL